MIDLAAGGSRHLSTPARHPFEPQRPAADTGRNTGGNSGKLCFRHFFFDHLPITASYIQVTALPEGAARPPHYHGHSDESGRV